MRCMPYVVMGATFMVSNFKTVAMDSRFSFFISTVTFIALTVLSSICLEKVCPVKWSVILRSLDHFQFLSPTGEYVCIFHGFSFSEFLNFSLILIYFYWDHSCKFFFLWLPAGIVFFQTRGSCHQPITTFSLLLFVNFGSRHE